MALNCCKLFVCIFLHNTISSYRDVFGSGCIFSFYICYNCLIMTYTMLQFNQNYPFPRKYRLDIGLLPLHFPSCMFIFVCCLA